MSPRQSLLAWRYKRHTSQCLVFLAPENMSSERWRAVCARIERCLRTKSGAHNSKVRALIRPLAVDLEVTWYPALPAHAQALLARDPACTVTPDNLIYFE